MGTLAFALARCSEPLPCLGAHLGKCDDHRALSLLFQQQRSESPETSSLLSWETLGEHTGGHACENPERSNRPCVFVQRWEVSVTIGAHSQDRLFPLGPRPLYLALFPVPVSLHTFLHVSYISGCCRLFKLYNNVLDKVHLKPFLFTELKSFSA